MELVEEGWATLTLVYIKYDIMNISQPHTEGCDVFSFYVHYAHHGGLVWFSFSCHLAYPVLFMLRFDIIILVIIVFLICAVLIALKKL